MKVGLALLLVACVAMSASANAKRHVVILDFEGPRVLAGRAQHVVRNALGDRYDYVPTSRWEMARMTTCQRGPKAWEQAAIASKTDVVVEGWVDPTERPTVLTVSVRDARTGRQVDTVWAPISDAGVVRDDDLRTLTVQLDELVDYDWTLMRPERF